MDSGIHIFINWDEIFNILMLDYFFNKEKDVKLINQCQKEERNSYSNISCVYDFEEIFTFITLKACSACI